MDLSLISLSSLASQCNIASDISVAVLDMSLDDLSVLSDGMKQIMELSVNPNLGTNIDVSI